jgi:hypothetical protein
MYDKILRQILESRAEQQLVYDECRLIRLCLFSPAG